MAMKMMAGRRRRRSIARDFIDANAANERCHRHCDFWLCLRKNLSNTCVFDAFRNNDFNYTDLSRDNLEQKFNFPNAEIKRKVKYILYVYIVSPELNEKSRMGQVVVGSEANS